MNMPKKPSPEDYAINVAAPPGFDAQAVPIHQVCAHEKKVAKEFLEPAGLKRRLQSPPEWQPEITDENRHVIAADIIAKREAAGKVTKAAVLIPLVLKEAGLSSVNKVLEQVNLSKEKLAQTSDYFLCKTKCTLHEKPLLSLSVVAVIGMAIGAMIARK